MRRVVCDFPAPVRDAHTATTGFDDRSIVASGPSRRKSAPAAIASAARCITSGYERSL